jgi:hypothetical protein
MKTTSLLILLWVLLPLVGYAHTVVVYTFNDPIQDDWSFSGSAEELVEGIADADELILVEPVTWEGHYPCPAEWSGSDVNMVQLRMTNLTSRAFGQLIYVADPQTDLTNWDEYVGNAGLDDAEKAFLIDWSGENTPLVFESIANDAIFQVGEVWEFVIQDYTNSAAGPADDIDSVGIASLSTGWTPSTGSIIAMIPEPSVLSLLAGACAMLSALRHPRRE